MEAGQGDTRPRVGVVGAGVGGLAAAISLASAGAAVTVFDPAAGAGGLAGGFEVGGGSVEKFYHHIFRSDRTAQRWITDLGLGERLEWLPADMGFYSGGRLYKFGTPLSLLGFAPLSFADRVRLGLRVRGLSTTADPAAFENVTAVDWLRARTSTRELETFWLPLLKAKFGADLGMVSMAWLWARFRARVGGAVGRKERLGYLRGGFQQLGDRLADRAHELGVEIRLGTRVNSVAIEDGRISGLDTAAGWFAADAVIWTPSLNALARAVPVLPEAYRATCEDLRYHMAVVAVLEMPESVLPYYWVTVGDDRLPFTVAVEHTRLVGTADYSGRTVIYLGRYADPGADVTSAPDDVVLNDFIEAAATAFNPAFRKPLKAHLFRAPGAQPVVPPGWETGRPALRTGVPGLVAANMAQIYPWDRGINYSIELGVEAAKAVQEELQAASAR